MSLWLVGTVRCVDVVEVWLLTFITLVLDGISGRFMFRPFYPGDRAFTHHIGGLFSSRLGNMFMVFVYVFSFRTLSQCVVSLSDVWWKMKKGTQNRETFIFVGCKSWM
jgi:hypothetical protein